MRALAAGLLALALIPAWWIAPAWAQDSMRTEWEQAYYGQWRGGEVLLHNSSIQFGKLAFGDLDRNGRSDLLVGKEDGRIDRFRNEGKPGAPRWRLVEENLTALARSGGEGTEAARAPISVGTHAAPVLVDIDQDRDLDLFVGSGDGRLFFYRNIGNPVLPAFMLVNDNFISRNFGHNLVPAFSDVDKNRTADLLLGNQQGEVYLLVNQGTRRRAVFCIQFPPPDAEPDQPPPCTPVPQRLLSIAPESMAVPGMTDWDGDGDPDLFVGKSNGTIAYYENKGNAFAGEWRLVQNRFLAIDEGGFAAPAFMDINGDQRPDMLIGSSTNNVSVYTYKGTGNPLDVWKVTGNLLQVERFSSGLRQVVVSSGDIDGDKDLDLVVGDLGGQLVLLENTGAPDNPSWRPMRAGILTGGLRRRAAPLLADLDADGDLDLLVGGIDGQLWLLRNKGSAKAPTFFLETAKFAAIDVGNDSQPNVQDIDQDGDLDLFVGNRRGLVIFYRNDGNAKQPDFRLASTRFSGLSVKLNAAPAFFDWDGDKKPDLVVGSREGALVLSVNKNQPKDPKQGEWSLTGPRWGDFGGNGYSAPHFADLNGDGKPDLLLGDGAGNVKLWWNRGALRKEAPRPAVTQTEAQQAEALQPPAEAEEVAGLTPGQPQTTSESGLQELVQASEEPVAPAATAEEILSAPLEPAGPLAPVFREASKQFANLRFDSRVAPAFGDVDGDGDQDLVIGTAKGKLFYFRNDGDNKQHKFTRVTDKLAGFAEGGSPAPTLADLDGDQRMDLLVGTEDGRVLFYKNQGNPAQPFALVEGALANVKVRRKAAPAVGRINADPFADLILGDFAGKLHTFVREGGAQSLNFTLQDRKYMGVDVGVASTPFVGDLDRDKSPELLIGSDQGRLVFFTRGGGKKPNAWGWATGEGYLENLKFPFGTRPVLADLDGDGDMDLFVGTEGGTIYHFRNGALGEEGPSN